MSNTPPNAPARDWFARVLLVITWTGLAVAWFSTPANEDPTVALTHALHPPSSRELCPIRGDADPTRLGDVMEAGISPLMSKLTFVLHHGRGSDVQKGETVVKTAAEMLGCIQLASASLPSSRPELKTHYIDLMEDFRDSVALLQLSAVENDLKGAMHRYEHMRYECARCHMLFKSAAAEE